MAGGNIQSIMLPPFLFLAVLFLLPHNCMPVMCAWFNSGYTSREPLIKLCTAALWPEFSLVAWVERSEAQQISARSCWASLHSTQPTLLCALAIFDFVSDHHRLFVQIKNHIPFPHNTPAPENSCTSLWHASGSDDGLRVLSRF